MRRFLHHHTRGFTLIELMIVIAIIAIIAAIAIPNLIASRKTANETSALSALRTVSSAEAIFREADRDRDNNLDYGMLSELSNFGLLDVVLGSGTRQGYYFQAGYSTSSSEFLWFGTTFPQLVGHTGDRYFATNQSGILYYTTGSTFVFDVNTCLLPGTTGAILTGK